MTDVPPEKNIPEPASQQNIKLNTTSNNTLESQQNETIQAYKEKVMKLEAEMPKVIKVE